MKKALINILRIVGLLNFIRLLILICNDCLLKLQLYNAKIYWRSINTHNQTEMEKIFPFNKVSVGNETYGPLCVHHFCHPDERLIIGNYCSISKGVKFILGGNHNTNTFSTFPFRNKFNNGEVEAFTKGPIIVEDDVWIGTDAIILSGVTLGKGSIVAAGSIVTKSSQPYSIIGGNPAKIIKMRFDKDLIALLLDIDFLQIDKNKVRSFLKYIYFPLNENILFKIKNELIKKPI